MGPTLFNMSATTVEKVVQSESSITCILEETIYKANGIHGAPPTEAEMNAIDKEYHVSKYMTFLYYHLQGI